jgi:entericidin B
VERLMTENGKTTDLLRALIAIAMLAFAVGTLSACNTAEGLGKDVKAAGDAIEDTAEETEEEFED